MEDHAIIDEEGLGRGVAGGQWLEGRDSPYEVM